MRYAIAAPLIRAANVLKSPQACALLPASCLCAYWAGGETALVATTIGLTTAASVLNIAQKERFTRPNNDALTGLPLRSTLLKALTEILKGQKQTGRSTACIALSIDDFTGVQDSYGIDAANTILKTVANRLQKVMREYDLLARLDGPRFAVALAPMRHADLETLIQFSSRIQNILSEPCSINATKVYISTSIGFCLPERAPAQSGASFLGAAEQALMDARANGAGSIRSFTRNTAVTTLNKNHIFTEIEEALDSGQIIPWFQPQICTNTGTISGMEALARWIHPHAGVVPPSDFMPALEENGLMERLSEVILHHSLTALKAWDKAGFNVPTISVNFSTVELSNPKLVDKIRWELDRFDLTPQRLTVEILENVIAPAEDDSITRNIWALSQLGCGIDLDDFGTEHASIANIRRFAVKRIKIDRSYVTHCDTDREQQNMLAAILTMAERIELETLAEGIETPGEHAMLAQLGCGHVQGYLISHPISFEKTLDWIENHNKKLAPTPKIRRKAS